MRYYTKRTRWAAVALLLAGVVVAAASEPESYRDVDARECPILDTPYRTASAFDVSYTAAAATDTPGWGDELSVGEVNVWARFLNWENELGSEFEVQLRVDTTVLEGFANASNEDSVYSLWMGRLFVQWSQRYVNGYGMQLHASPGLYTGQDGLDGDVFSCPAGLTLIKAFTPNFALFAGANVYPDFDLQVDPVAGMMYAYRDEVVFQLAYPESRFEYGPVPSFRLVMGARMRLWPEYSLGSEDARERLQYDEGRAFAGIEWGCTERTQISLQGGYAFGRTISFESGAADVDLEDAPFAMIGIRGRL